MSIVEGIVLIVCVSLVAQLILKLHYNHVNRPAKPKTKDKER